MRAFDISLFHAINGWPERMAPVMVFLSNATKDSGVRFALIGLFLTLVIAKGTRRTGWCLAPAFLLANEVCDVLKASLKMARPCVDLPDVILRVDLMTSYGTASAHSANMAAVAFVVTYFHRAWGAPWIVVAFLTGISRIYVGVHYPSQVLFGWAVGIFSGFLVVKTVEAFVAVRAKKNHDEPNDAPAG